MIDGVPSQSALVSDIVSICNNRLHLKTREPLRLDDEDIKVLVASLKILHEKLEVEVMEVVFLNLLDALHIRGQELHNSAMKLIEDGQFGPVVAIVDELANACDEVSENALNKREGIMAALATKIDSIANPSILTKERFSEHDIEDLSHRIDALEELERNGIEERIKQECTVKGTSYTSAVDRLRHHLVGIFNKQATKINEGLEHDLRNEEAEQIFNQLRLLRRIQSLQALTAETFHSTRSTFRNYFDKLRVDAENAAKTLHENAGIVDYKRIAAQLRTLKRWCELNKEDVDITATFEGIQEELVTTAQGGYLHKVGDVYAAINDMRPLVEQIPDIGSVLEAADKDVRDAVTPIIRQFETYFDLKGLELESFRARHAALHSALGAFDTVQARLKEEGFESVNGVRSALKVAEDEIKELEDSIEREKRDFEKDEVEILSKMQEGNGDSTERRRLAKKIDEILEQSASFEEVSKRELQSLIDKKHKLQALANEMSNALDSQLSPLKPEEKESFLANNLEGVEAIRQELRDLIGKLDSLPKSVSYDFRQKDLQPELIEQAWDFYETLSDTSPLQENPMIPDNALQQLQFFLSQYVSFFKKELESLVERVKSIIKGGGEGFSEVIRPLVSCFERFENLNDSARIRAYLKSAGEDYHATVRKHLKDIHQVLHGEIHAAQTVNDRSRLSSLVSITSLLVEVDGHTKTLHNESFQILWEKANKHLETEDKDGLEGFKTALHEHRFGEAASLLCGVFRGNFGRSKQDRHCNEFEHSIQKYLSTASSLADDLAARIEEKDPYSEEVQRKIRALTDASNVIRDAASSDDVKQLLGARERTLEKLQRWREEVTQVLTTNIKEGCERIKGKIDLDWFNDAEKCLQNLQVFQQRLAACDCIDAEQVAKEIQVVVIKLDELADQIEKREAFDDISKWAENSPKTLVTKLVDLQSTSGRYGKAKTSALERTKDCYVKKFKEAEASSSDYQAMSKLFNELTRAKDYLPDHHLADFEYRLSSLNDQVMLAGENNAKRIDNALASLESGKEPAFAEVLQLYNEKSKSDANVARKLNEGITRCVEKCAKVVCDATTMRDALHSTRTLRLYEQKLYFNMDVRRISEEIRHLLQTQVKASATTVEGFSKRKTSDVLQALDDLVVCRDFIEHEPDQQVLEKDTLQIITSALVAAKIYISQQQTEVDAAFTSWDPREIKKSNYERLRSWAPISENIDKALRENESMEVSKRLEKRMSEIVDMIRRNLDMELITEDTKQFAQKRKTMVETLALWYERAAYSTSREFVSIMGETEAKTLVRHKQNLEQRIHECGKRLTSLGQQQRLSDEDCIDFRIYFELLSDIDNDQRFAELKVGQKYLTQAKTSVLQLSKNLRTKVEEQAQRKEEADIQVVTDSLIEMKKLEQNLIFGDEIRKEIDGALQIFKDKQTQCSGVMKLCAVLCTSDYGNKLIADHKALSGEDRRMRREKMQKQDDLEYVLQKLEGDDLNQEALREAHKRYKDVYDDLLKRGLGLLATRSKGAAQESITKAKSVIHQHCDQIWRPQSFVPEALAAICSVWTLLNTEDYNEERGNDKMEYLLTPHVAQIISVFRILGLGYSSKQSHKKEVPTSLMRKCLVEVGTGEGKSFILAMVASIFALLGCEVDCSCYSEYLSDRDQKAFESVYEHLDIRHLVRYNTFNKICEGILNSDCDIRTQIRDAILSNESPKGKKDDGRQRSRPRVLLIDEVDVFLSERFYGGVYAPATFVESESFKALLDYMWERRGNMNDKQTGYRCPLTFAQIKQSNEYQECLRNHSKWEALLVESIRDALASLKSLKTMQYRVEEDVIQYLDGDAFVSNIMHGYQTVWAYYHEHHFGKVTSLVGKVGMIVKCGTFSYAEIPHQFEFIAGVTGTLKTLSDTEKAILRNDYGIASYTFMPSVFGENIRHYRPSEHVMVTSTPNEYYDHIMQDIDEKCRAMRAILVFFHDGPSLTAFFESKQFEIFRKPGKYKYQIIAEDVAPSDRELRVKRAGTEGMITLLTASFGRGTDFVCRNPQLLANGGIHVLQTFYSDEKSEEFQIMGRAARQGDRGSYAMVLLEQHLEWVLGPDSSTICQQARSGGRHIHEILQEKRSALYETKCSAKSKGIKQRQKEHKESLNFMDKVKNRDLSGCIRFLQEYNKVSSGNGSRTVLLMDATGSMSASLAATKETVCVMFERASEVLREHGSPSDSFQLQIAVYRNYSSCISGNILQASGWESNPIRLREFMNGIGVSGGQGNEAIEIGLAHAVEQHTEQPIDQVILIGDMPPNTREEVRSKRSSFFAMGVSNYPETYWENELEKLDDVPVHAYYVHRNAKVAFSEIARRTGGRCEFLDINSPRGAEMLTGMVTEEILRKAGKEQGEALVNAYRTKYYTS